MNTNDKTLADVQPGGRVRLGDADPMRSALEDALQFVETLHSTVSGDSRKIVWRCLERGRAALSAHPSPGGQGAPEIEQLQKLVSSILSTVSLGYQTGPHAYAGEDFGGYLHEAASNCRTILRALSALAARQPVYEGHTWVSDYVLAGLRERAALPLQLRNGEVWHWQGDGHDFPESLACPVIMSAESLRALLAARQPVGGPVTVAYGPISLPPVPHGQVMPPDDRTGLYPVAHDDEAMQDYAREAVEADREQLAAGVVHIKGAVLIDGTVHLVQKGEEINWVYGHVDGRKAKLLYAAPPAQAVDPGQFRKVIVKYRDSLTHRRYDAKEIAECNRLLALIDSQAVGK